MNKKLFYWFLPLGWMGVIFYASSMPYDNQDIKPMLGNINLTFLEPLTNWIHFTYNHSIISVQALGINGLLEFFIRKGAHVFSFFLLTSLLFLAFYKTTKFTIPTQLSISILTTVAYAILDEFHQSLTPNRTPYVGDVILDSIGGLLAVIFWFFWNNRRWKRQKKC